MRVRRTLTLARGVNPLFRCSVIGVKIVLRMYSLFIELLLLVEQLGILNSFNINLTISTRFNIIELMK